VAQRCEEEFQDAPLAVTALCTAAMEEKQINLIATACASISGGARSKGKYLTGMLREYRDAFFDRVRI
jgi:hypothetical protein